MDDKAFEQWSEILSGLRGQRVGSVENLIKEKGAQLDIKQYFRVATASLEEVLAKWFEMEQASYQGLQTPEEKDLGREKSKIEMESVFDFEMDALLQEMAQIRRSVSWSEQTIQKCQSDLKAFSEKMRKDYRIRAETLGAPPSKKKKEEDTQGRPLPKAREPQRVVGGSSSGGTGTFFMFLFGLLLGCGAAVHFWYAGTVKAKKHQEEMAKVLAEKKAVEDYVMLIRETFNSLSYGKIRNIPQIEKEIRKIKSSAEAKRKKARKYYTSRRENLLRKAFPGDKLDRSLSKLDEEVEKQINKINAREAAQLKPCLKELQAFQDVMKE